MEFRPCIDIHNGKVKQIVGGSLKDEGNAAEENFVSEQDAVFFAEFYKKYKVRGGHHPGNAVGYLNAGASHVIVTSYVFQGGNIHYGRLKELADLIGRERLVLDLSCRKRNGAYYIVTDRWQNYTEAELNEETLDLLSAYCSEFLVHAVDVEGKAEGIERPIVSLLGEWGKLPVTYAGGVHDFQDLELLRMLGKERVNVTIGSALDLFGGNMKFSDVIAWMYGGTDGADEKQSADETI